MDFGLPWSILEVIGLILDSDNDQARRFLNELAWWRGFLGGDKSRDVPHRFGVSSIPTYILVDPNGLIVMHADSPDGIADLLND